MVDGLNRGVGEKVIWVPSDDQETAPAIHAPSERRWRAKELVEPLTAVAIPSDQVTTTFAFSGTLAALGAGSRVPIIGGVESTSKWVEELVP